MVGGVNTEGNIFILETWDRYLKASFFYPVGELCRVHTALWQNDLVKNAT